MSSLLCRIDYFWTFLKIMLLKFDHDWISHSYNFYLLLWLFMYLRSMKLVMPSVHLSVFLSWGEPFKWSLLRSVSKRLVCLLKFVKRHCSLKRGEGGPCYKMSYLPVCYHFFSGWEWNCLPKYHLRVVVLNLTFWVLNLCLPVWYCFKSQFPFYHLPE